MREILFRGKLIGTGEWAYGNLNRTIKGTNIITPDETLIGKYGAVIPETVGQYTGLTDKSGKRIFEGDIVKDSYGDSYVIKYGRCGLSCCGCCYHSHDSMGFYLCSEEGYALSDEDVWDNLEIIGNIAERRC